MKKPSKAELQTALDAVLRCGGEFAASRELKIPRTTLQSRVAAAKIAGLKPSPGAPDQIPALKQKVKQLEADLKAASKQSANAQAIKEAIGSLGLALDETKPPRWTSEIRNVKSPGVPTLFLSDFHWGEVVAPSQINGVNKFNLSIARERLHYTVDTAIHLLRILDRKMDYPGIVVPLGGDMISGNIHDELQATNELNTMPTVLDLYGELITAIEKLADQFGEVFLPCVSGNHGRDTHKIWAKDRNNTSFDWLLYQFLAKHFVDDKRVTFFIPDGPDAYYRIYDHRYLLTHGDQFRGGDGMIGALGPIIRGDHKKRSRNAQINMEYDTLICGHWHQYLQLRRLIVNGSLKGLDEYAYSNNFPFEPPTQALWVTHSEYGITYRMPVFCDKIQKRQSAAWVSTQKQGG